MSDASATNGDGLIPDSLIDALFDRELGPDARDELLRAARHDPVSRSRIAESSAMLADLRTPVRCPDMVDSILGEADRRRGFLPARLRRAVSMSRVAAAAALVLATVGVAGVQRLSPDLLRLGSSAGHVTEVSRAVHDDTAQGCETITEGFQRARQLMTPLSADAGVLAIVRSTEIDEDGELFTSCGGLVDGRRVGREYVLMRIERARASEQTSAALLWAGGESPRRASLLPAVYGREPAPRASSRVSGTDRTRRNELP